LQTYLISWNSPNANSQFKASKLFVEWYESGGPESDPKGFERIGWCSLIHNGSGVSIVKAESLELIWQVYAKWREMGLEIKIEPVATMEEAYSCLKSMT